MLSRLAKELCDSFVKILGRAAGKDDCVELLYSALFSMDHSQSLNFPRKAGIIAISQ